MPLPPPPADALIERRKPDALERLLDAAIRLIVGRLARDDRHAGGRMSRRASIFDPMRAMTSDGGPTKIRPACSHASAKRGVLGQKPVAGVDGVRAGRLRAASMRPGIER